MSQNYEDHLRQAKHNERFLSLIEDNYPDDFFDWKITVCFYIIVHYIDGFFLSHGISISDHKQRRIQLLLKDYPIINDEFYTHYENIYYMCMSARYDGFKDKKKFIRHQSEKLKEAKEAVSFIRQSIEEDIAQM